MYIVTIKYFSGIQRNAVLPFMSTCLELKRLHYLLFQRLNYKGPDRLLMVLAFWSPTYRMGSAKLSKLGFLFLFGD